MNTNPSRWLWAGAVVLALLFLAGLLPRLGRSKHLSTQTSLLATPHVTVVRPEMKTVPLFLTLPGDVKPFAEASIHSRAKGYLKAWHADLGQRVKKGEKLAEIDSPELTIQLSQARAELAQSKASLELAGATARRWAELLEGKAISPQEAEEKQSDLKVKAAQTEALKMNVTRLEQLEAFTVLEAPFDGVVTRRFAEVGQLVLADSFENNRELFHLSDTSKLRIFVRIPQAQAALVAVGQLAEIQRPEAPTTPLNAKVVRASDSLEGETKTRLIELEMENPGTALLAGSHVEVRLALGAGKPALTLPANTLLFRAEGVQVGVVSEQGVVSLRTIRLGRDMGGKVEVLEGVQASDKVILNPSDSLTEGARVEPAEPPAQGSSSR